MTSLSQSAPLSGAALLESIASANPAMHSHLTALISHLIQHKPSDPFHSLEKLSSSLLNPSNPPHPLLSSPPSSTLLSYLTSSPYLFNRLPPPAPASEDEEPAAEEEPPAIPSFIPDVSSLAALLREAGVALTEEEVALVDRAAVQLGQREGVESIRFWGKVLVTSGADYYVFEVKKASYDDDEERERISRERISADTGDDVAANRELLGSGANEYLYFTTQTLSTPSPQFTQLPSTCPRFVTDARRTRRLLTGRLQAAVGGFPAFAGVEADLLRAQIARITQGTVMAPKGSWKEEEGDVVIEDEEWRGNAPGRTVDWVHARPHLRRDGRVELSPDEEEEDEEDEAKKAAKAAAKAAAFEAKRPLLAPAAANAFSARTQSAYDTAREEARGVGEDGEGEEGRKAVSAVVASCWSVLWPGSVTVARGKEYGSVYVGWALRAGQGRVEELPPREEEWDGDLVEAVETIATEEEEKKEREEEEERKKEEGDKKAEEDEDDGLPADEADAANDDE